MSAARVGTKFVLIWNLKVGWKWLYSPLLKGTVEASFMGLVEPSEHLQLQLPLIQKGLSFVRVDIMKEKLVEFQTKTDAFPTGRT